MDGRTAGTACSRAPGALRAGPCRRRRDGRHARPLAGETDAMLGPSQDVSVIVSLRAAPRPAGPDRNRAPPGQTPSGHRETRPRRGDTGSPRESDGPAPPRVPPAGGEGRPDAPPPQAANNGAGAGGAPLKGPTHGLTHRGSPWARAPRCSHAGKAEAPASGPALGSSFLLGQTRRFPAEPAPSLRADAGGRPT